MSPLGISATLALGVAAIIGTMSVYEYSLADISSQSEIKYRQGLKIEDKIERGSQLFLQVHEREPISHNELIGTGFLPAYANRITNRSNAEENIVEKFQRAVNDWSKDPSVSKAEILSFTEGGTYSSLPSSVQDAITEDEYNMIKSLDTQVAMEYNKLTYDPTTTTQAVRDRADKQRISSSLRNKNADDTITATSSVENKTKLEEKRKEIIFQGIKNVAMEGNVDMANYISILAKKAYGDEKAKEIITAGMNSAISDKTALLSNLNPQQSSGSITSNANTVSVTAEVLDSRIQSVKNVFQEKQLITN